MIESYRLTAVRVTPRRTDVLADLVGDGIVIAAYFSPEAGVRRGDKFTVQRTGQATWIVKHKGVVVYPIVWHFPD